MKNANALLVSFPHDLGTKHVDVRPLWLKQRRLTPGRFRKLAEFLSDLPAKHFCMETWVTVAEEPVGLEPTTVPRQTCGTTACIAGWATTMDFAKKRSVKLFLQQHKNSGYVDIYASLPPSVMGWKTKEPVLTFYPALEMFFGLVAEEIEEIFFNDRLSKEDAINLLRKKARQIESEPVPLEGQLYMTHRV